MPDVPHVQNSDRVEAARVAVEDLETQLILMDDGYQHRRLHRDLNLLVIDATCPFGFGHVLPRGLLREPLKEIRRADLAMISRSDQVSESELESLEQQLRRYHPDLPNVRCNHSPKRLLEYPDQFMPTESLAGQRVAVVSAIGNPDSFVRTVENCGAKIVNSKTLPDHDAYAPETVRQLQDWIVSLGDSISRVVCTHKDLVKLQTAKIGGKPLAAMIVELTLVGEDSPLHTRLNKLLSSLKENRTRNG
jgi:tetraacyldisaccharide 4'-kinase